MTTTKRIAELEEELKVYKENCLEKDAKILNLKYGLAEYSDKLCRLNWLQEALASIVAAVEYEAGETLDWKDVRDEDDLDNLKKKLQECQDSKREAIKWIERAQERIHPASKPPADHNTWTYLNEALWYLTTKNESD